MSLSGDSFDVTLENGQPLIKVEGKLFSVLAQRKTVRDMQGNHLFDIEKEVMHVHTTFALKDPNGNKFMEVKSSIKRMLTPFPSFWFHNLKLTLFAVLHSPPHRLQDNGDFYQPADGPAADAPDEGPLHGHDLRDCAPGVGRRRRAHQTQGVQHARSVRTADVPRHRCARRRHGPDRRPVHLHGREEGERRELNLLNECFDTQD